MATQPRSLATAINVNLTIPRADARDLLEWAGRGAGEKQAKDQTIAGHLLSIVEAALAEYRVNRIQEKKKQDEADRRPQAANRELSPDVHRTKLSPEMKQKILFLRDEGMRRAEIARRFGISYRHVTYILEERERRLKELGVPEVQRHAVKPDSRSANAWGRISLRGEE
jgi:hypothetical protein